MVVGQLMSALASEPSVSTARVGPQAPDCQVATEPSDRATRHRVDVGHDTEKVSAPAPGTGWPTDQVEPSDTRTWPVRSTAMQKRVVGHETECRSDCPGDGRVVHDLPSKVAMFPVAETTTQEVGVAHEMFWTGLVAVPWSTTASWGSAATGDSSTCPSKPAQTNTSSLGTYRAARGSRRRFLVFARPSVTEMVNRSPSSR